MLLPKLILESKEFHKMNTYERLLYLVIGIAMMPYGNSVKPLPFYAQINLLAKYCGCSEITIKRTLKKLRQKGLARTFGANSNRKWCIVELWEKEESTGRYYGVDIKTRKEKPVDYKWLYQEGLRKTAKENILKSTDKEKVEKDEK